jgi:hypothetical protein
MGPATKPEPVASAATSLTASQQLLSTRRLAMSEESNPWEDETKPLTASTRLARTPPGVELDSTVAERSKSGGRTSSRRLAIDEAEKFVETERRSWRVVVLGALGVVTLATVAIAFFMTDGFGILPRADTDAEGAARTRPRTSALDEPAGEPGARPGGKGMTTKLQPGPGAAAVPPGQAPGGATTEPPPSDAAGEVRPGAAGTGDLDLPVLAAPPPAPPAPSNDAHDGAAAGAASGPSSAPSDGVLDPRVVTAAIEAGELHVLDLMLVAPALAATKFDVAVSLCRTRDIRGIDGFRLPTIKELQRLRKARMIRPSHVYWSGDPSKSGERAVLEDGAVRRVEPSGLAKVVCVRSQ